MLILFFLFWLALKLPVVQNWLAQRATEYLSKELDTKITVEKVEIQLFNKASFKNFYMEDKNRDTLIFASNAVGYFDISKILKGKFYITAVDFNDAVLNYQRLEGQKEYNITTFMRYFMPKKKRNKPSTFQLAINKISGKNIRFKLLDEVLGLRLDVLSPYTEIFSKNNNLAKQKAVVDSLFAEDTKINISIFKGTPLPDSVRKAIAASMKILNWELKADNIHFKNFDLNFSNQKFGARPELPLDFNDLRMTGANLKADDIDLKDYIINCSIKEFNAKEQRGFVVNSFYGDIMCGPKGASLRNFELKTPNSTIGNQLELIYDKYPDFLNFSKKVKIIASVNNAEIAFSDIMSFAAPLNKNIFFKSNKEKVINIDGYFEGKVDSFTFSDVVINMNRTHLEGNISMMPFKKFMNFEIQELQTDYGDLKSLLSFTKIPKEIANLGKINYYGDFNGFLDGDFTTRGNLYSDLGELNLNLNMNPKGGVKNVKYEGKLNLSDFNIGKLLGIKDVGKIDAYVDVDGKGLNVEGLEARVRESRINYFDFKGYRYDTIYLNGIFDKKKFNGEVESRDNNFNLQLAGIIDFNQLKPKFNLSGSVGRIDFCALNILKDDLILSVSQFDLDFSGLKVDEIAGSSSLKKITFHRGWGDYYIDSIYLNAKDLMSGNNFSRELTLRSDVLSATVRGNYNLTDLPKSAIAFTDKFYPNFARALNISSKDSSEASLFDLLNPVHAFDTMKHQDMSIDLKLYDSKKLTEIISPDFKFVKGAIFKFDYNSSSEKFSTQLEIDSIRWGKYLIKNEKLFGEGIKNRLNFENSLSQIQFSDTTYLPAPYIKIGGKGDSISFNIAVNEIGKFASNVNLNGDFKFSKESVRARLNNSNLRFLGNKWEVEGDNYLSFDFVNKNLFVNNLLLKDSAAVQKIALYSYGNKGLQLKVDNISLSKIYTPVKLPLFDIDGRLNANVKIEDIFAQKNLSAEVNFENLIINKDKWNNARLELRSPSLKDTIFGEFFHNGPLAETLNADFYFIPAFATTVPQEKNYVNVNFDAKSAKGRILEYFMVGQLTNTLGTADAKGRIYGKAPKLNIEGLAKVKNLQTTFNFLNTRYFIDTASVVLSNEGMIFSPSLVFDEKNERVKEGIKVRDQEGNIGYMGGRITHKYLKEWGIDLDLIFNKNLTLNTTAESNMPFYGKVWASGRANISGPFTKMTMIIDAVTEYGPKNEMSVLVLPIMKPVEINQAIDFLVFKDMKDSSTTADKKIKVVSGGIEVLMKIKATTASMARIIIDEQAGDVIEGSGNGNLQLNYTPSGELYLRGDYEIENGNYLFTYRNLINKPFKVEKGGTIRWSGDPYNADVNIKAKYVQKSRLYNLLLSYQEELQNSETRDAANKPVDIEVLMNMTGSLMRPDIKFGLNVVGAVQGRVSTLANLALRAIQQDESKLNRQVFGLIALNQFLPEENAAANLNLGASSFNTLSEMVSQQFSRYLGDLLSEVVEGQNVISSIDVQFGYKMEDDQLSNAGTGSQFDLSIDNYFFQDKMRVHIGGNLDVNNNQTGANQNYFGGDLIVEYSISGDGNLKVKLYNRYENSLFGQRNRAGGGVSYQIDFDSLMKSKKEREEAKALREKRRADRRKEEEEKVLQ